MHFMYTLSDFDFALPPELIAQTPSPERSQSRLLEVGDAFMEYGFSDLPTCLKPGDLLIFNNTRVIKARLFGEKSTGGRIEVLVERLIDDRTVLAQIRASKSPKKGSRLHLAGAFEAEVGERQGSFYLLTFPEAATSLLERYGQLPLPPYIDRPSDTIDESRYQTVFASVPGAVAAPTAGLHFDETLMAAIQQQGMLTAEITLHVGAGTFQPVRTENLREHHMHAEQYEIPEATVDAILAARARGNDVIAVGTTSLRALEAASENGRLIPGRHETDIFITPGYAFQTVNRLVTNFHLPKSTLLMLVSAFAGYGRIRQAYAYAISQQYRFFSYGDAMLLTCAS